ncbi:MAG TPA: DUF2442 domain-containing protein [Candidatus Krumholzibacteria bacterium]|nr:DUF2442 domain-containing protein [Candidatus Krumholzibacteria bacterium]
MRRSRVHVTNRYLFLILADGRSYRIPRDLTPRLADATENQIRRWRFTGPAFIPTGIHWPDLDEDLAINETLDEFQLSPADED